MKTPWFLSIPSWLMDGSHWAALVLGLYAAIKARSAKMAVAALIEAATPPALTVATTYVAPATPDALHADKPQLKE